MRRGLIVGLGGDLVEDLVEEDLVGGFRSGDADVTIWGGGGVYGVGTLSP